MTNEMLVTSAQCRDCKWRAGIMKMFRNDLDAASAQMTEGAHCHEREKGHIVDLLSEPRPPMDDSFPEFGVGHFDTIEEFEAERLRLLARVRSSSEGE